MDLSLELVEQKLAEKIAMRNDLVIEVNCLNGAINVLENIKQALLNPPKPEAAPEPEPSLIVPG